MDKIVERLGDDALILETVKRNGRIEMVATDDPESPPAPAPRRAPATVQPERASPNLRGLDLEIGGGSPFTDLFDQQMVQTIRARDAAQTSAVDHLVGRAMEASENIDILTELKSIRTMLNGMMITKPDGLDVTLGHAAPVRLHQAGFSPKAIQTLHHHMVGLDDDDAIDCSFMNALADRVVHSDVDRVFARASSVWLAVLVLAKPLPPKSQPILRSMEFPTA